ncbi:nucleoside recognition membrane protein YjiH [Peptoniphilus olsenii]|uniref:Nucleoside recognition membrane protein YjiH n=1 Tax=Peptoniphilus olsenii TaxID=411570 RepID=A0ABV2J9J2_9FIRM
MDNIKKEKITTSRILRFLIPSILGVLLLMTPFKKDGASTIMVSVISKGINAGVESVVPIYILVLICIVISCSLAIIYKIAKPSWIENNELLKEVSDISNFWLFARIVGLVIGFMTAFEIGPEIIYSPDTGGLILYDLICGLFTIFLVAGFILPFLTEFGLLEYIGVFLTSIMRPVFNLPGRSAIDCVASWIGDGTIGVTLTNKQYEEGYYTAREAAVISTTFSAVSITFCLVVLENVGMTNYFGPFYLAVGVAGIVAALILPRIYPLSSKKDVYMNNQQKAMPEAIPEGFTKHEWGLQLAVKKAEENGGIKEYLTSGVKTVLGLWLGVIPIIMAAGTLALVVSEATPFFDIMGKPFLPLLKLLQVPEAEAASATMVVGFADMVVPSILAAEIANPMTQFIIAAVSVTQLLYMSETGAVILGTNLPVTLLDLFILFLERTIITLPIIVVFAHIFF